MIKRSLDPLLLQVRPAFIENIEMYSFTVGENTPFIKYMKVFELSEGSKKPLSWMNVSQPPPGLSKSQQYQLVLEMDIGLHSEDFKMVFRNRLGGKWMGMNLDVAVEKLNIMGKMQLILQMNMDAPFPHISMFTLQFLEKPEVWFAIRMMKSVQMMDIPVLKSWIHSLVMDGLTQALVDPGKVDIRMQSTGPNYAPAKSRSRAKAEGVLTVTISSAEQSKGMFSDDIRYCSLHVGEQKEHTQKVSGSGAWQDACSFLVDSLDTDKLSIKLKSKRLLSTYVLAQFDVMLGDYGLEEKAIVDTFVEEKSSKWQTTNPVRMDLTLEYTKLPTITTEVEKETEKPYEPADNVSGVMYICVHSGHDLLAADRTGTSDPYCIIFSNGKKIKTTHYVCRNRSPVWEVSTEFIVGDFTKTMLSFLVYDWDGHNASEDDFLGSAYVVLTQDERRLIKRDLALGYNLGSMGQGQNDNKVKLGHITCSIIFRPVATVAKSEISSVGTHVSFQDHQSALRGGKNFMTSATSAIEKASTSAIATASLLVHTGLQFGKKNKLVGGPKEMGVGDLLSLGYGILELNIMRAKDLVAMDSNGFSDPFCEVRIGNERKFTTSCKKKTLNPVWDEWVTTQLPQQHEMLDIVVWDRDPFFKKDFLGSVHFSLDDLKKYSKKIENDGWFQLQRIQNGSVQLGFKVITEDGELAGSCGAESNDSGMAAEDEAAESTEGKPMSPIEETGVVGSAVGNHRHSRSSEEDGYTIDGKSPSGRLLSMLPCVPHPESSEQSYSVMNTPQSSSGSAKTHRKAFGLRIRRSASDASIKNNKKLPVPRPSQEPVSSEEMQDGGYSPAELRKTDSLPANLDRETRSKRKKKRMKYRSLGNMDSESVGDLTQEESERYYGVRGQVLRGKGFQHVAESIYCKVRIDKRTLQERSLRLSSGRVICKSASMDADSSPNFDLEFWVDQRGRGVPKDALLIFDIKSHREHLATKGFTLASILGDGSEITKWLDLGGGMQVQINLRHGLSDGSRTKSGRFKPFAKSKDQ